MRKYTVIIEKDGESAPLRIKASDLLELNDKLSNYKYDSVLKILDNTYEKEMRKNSRKNFKLTNADIYSNELVRSRMNRTKQFVV